MKKRILTLLLSLAILVTFMPTMAFAEGNLEGRHHDWDPHYFGPVAEVTHYDDDGNVTETLPAYTLQWAFSLLFENNCKIKLLKDVDVFMPITMCGANAEDSATLDLNGHTIKSMFNFVALQVLHEGELTIDGTKSGSKIIGSVIAGNPMKYYNDEEITEYDVADLIINGGTYESNNLLVPTLGAYCCYYDVEDGEWRSTVRVNNAAVNKEVDLSEPDEYRNSFSLSEAQSLEESLNTEVIEAESLEAGPLDIFEPIMWALEDIKWLSASERETTIASAITVAGDTTWSEVNNSTITENIITDDDECIFDGYYDAEGEYHPAGAHAVEIEQNAELWFNNSKIESTDGGINAVQGSSVYVDQEADSELPESEIYADKVFKAINLGRYAPIADTDFGFENDYSYAEIYGGKFIVNDDNDSEYVRDYVNSPYGLKKYTSLLSEPIADYFQKYFEKNLDDVFFFNEANDGCRLRVYGGSFSKLPLKATFGDYENDDVEIKLLGEQSISKLDNGTVKNIEVADNSVLATIASLIWGNSDDYGRIPVSEDDKKVTKSVSALYDIEKLPEGVTVVVGEGGNLNLDANEEFKYCNLKHNSGWVEWKPLLEDWYDYDYDDFYEATGKKFPLHVLKQLIPQEAFSGGSTIAAVLSALNISDVVKEEKTTLADILEANGVKLVVENGGILTINEKEVSDVYAADKDSAYSVMFNEGNYDLEVVKGTVNVKASKSGLFNKQGDLDRTVNFIVNKGTTLHVPSGKSFTLSEGSKLQGKGEILVDGEMHVTDTAAVDGTIVVNGKLYVDDSNVASSFKIYCEKNGKVYDSQGVDVSSAYTTEKPEGDPGQGSGGGSGGGGTPDPQPVDELAAAKTSALAQIDKLIAGLNLSDTVKSLVYDGKLAINNAKNTSEVDSALVDALYNIKTQLEKEKEVKSLTLTTRKLSKNRVKLSWNPIPGAKVYNVYATKAGKTLRRVATVAGNSYTVKRVLGKKLVKGQKYKFRVVAYSDANTVLVKSAKKTVKR